MKTLKKSSQKNLWNLKKSLLSLLFGAENQENAQLELRLSTTLTGD